MHKTILFVLFLMVSSSAGAINEPCNEITEQLVSLGYETDPDKQIIIRDNLTKKLSTCSYGSCNLIIACELRSSPEKCLIGMRKAINLATNKISTSGETWALFLAELIKFTDGENTEKLLSSLSYLLPDNIELLANIIDTHEYLRRWTSSIVDPNLELRNMSMEALCGYFNEIVLKYSKQEGVAVSARKAEIVSWALEISKEYNCKIIKDTHP